MEPGYTLVITEKPDAGRRIAHALGSVTRFTAANVEALDVANSFNGEHYVVCSAAGHLYGVASQMNRSVYPVFDTEWLPLNAILSKRRSKSARKYAGLASMAGKRIASIRSLSKNAKKYVHACDYDLEGETIGVNILEFACGGKSALKNCKRAKFSTLTEAEVRESFSHLENIKESVSAAGRSRHTVDFVWGINLSRALSGAYKKSVNGYRNISIGRVQGPTLSFAADREVEINTHVPVPFWKIFADLESEGKRFEAHYEKIRVEIKSEADKIMNEVASAKTATVESVEDSVFEQPPPFPFNLGDLQAECFRRFRLSPSSTLKIAERLYLEALISYPRTNSQKLPESIGYQKIIQSLSSVQGYESSVEYVISKGRRFPRQGPKEDEAHPAIYPTGERLPARLSSQEEAVYDLVVRRFLASFGEDALISELFVRFLISRHIFEASGKRVLREGWMNVYPAKKSIEPQLPPKLKKGETIDVVLIREENQFEKAPSRFNQSSLLHLMEERNLGTKATRADIVATLIERGYLTESQSKSLQATEIGLQLVQAMRTHCPEIVSIDLTKRIESEIQQISEGSCSQLLVLGHAKEAVSLAIQEIREHEIELGSRLATAAKKSSDESFPTVGKCPVCIEGSLRLIKSHKTGKRFLGCSNFGKGCKASAPLPQKGAIKVQTRTCPSCKWPLVSVFLLHQRRRNSMPWVICPNLNCASRSVSH